MNEYVSVQGDRIEEIRDAAERFGDVEDYISIDIKKMIVDIKALLAEIDRLTAKLEELKQVSAEVCEVCGWAMKFPTEGCCKCRVEAAEARLVKSMRY